MKRNCLKNFPQSSHEKNIKQIPVEGHSAICLTNTPQNFKAIKSKEGLRNCHHQEEPKEMQQLMSWGILDGIPRQKRMLGKN